MVAERLFEDPHCYSVAHQGVLALLCLCIENGLLQCQCVGMVRGHNGCSRLCRTVAGLLLARRVPRTMVTCRGGHQHQKTENHFFHHLSQNLFCKGKKNIVYLHYLTINTDMTMKKKKITIALDGFSSTGKSTMAKWLAGQVGYAYVDTGAMYRAVALFCIENQLIDNGVVDEQALQERLADIRITFRPNKEGRSDTYLNGRNVEREIRGMEVSAVVSTVAAIGFVRRDMVRQQQAMGRNKGIVMDGRDIGTVVFPDAEMKVFVTASAEVRAQRRYDELRAKGDTTTTLEEVLQNVTERDRLDTTREESPLRQAPDAVVLDNSHMTIDEQNQWLLNLYKEKTSNR